MKDAVILFGAGINGQNISEKAKGIFQGRLLLYCDNDAKKQNTIYNGIEIIGFEKMLGLYHDGVIESLILTMSNEREILLQCVSSGIDVRDIYYWDMKCDVPRLIEEKYLQFILSQDGEELFLKELFLHKEKGTYIDIGANSPFRFSNTYWAYKRGWMGINIEPDIVNYELLKNIRKRDININCGISDKEAELDYYIFQENALNTFCVDEIECRDDVVDIRKVPVRRLDSILEEYNIWKIDYMDIDVEGMELSVLNSIDWDKVEIACILVEQKGLTLYEVLESDACKLLKGKGYVPINKYNRTVIYVREDE